MKYKQLVLGVLLGSLVTGAGAVAASGGASITALLKNEIIFKFNGMEKKLDKGYSVLSYKNVTYVPARFVAEELGATVTWDNGTQSILIDSAPATEPAKPTTQTAEWDKYDGEWSDKVVTAKLDFISETKANVDLKSTVKPEFDGMKFDVDFKAGNGNQVVRNGEAYSVTLTPTGSNLLLTIVNQATRVAFTAELKGNTPLPAAASSTSGSATNGTFTGNVDDYKGKWKNDKRSLTLSFDGSAAKLVFDNGGSEGLFDFTTDAKLVGEGAGTAEITKDGSKYLVSLNLGNQQVNLTVVNVASGQLNHIVFTAKE